MKSFRNAIRTVVSKRPAAIVMEGVEARRLFSTFVVTTTADGGTGSLRDAIKKANSHTGADVITFAIGSGKKTIYTATGLPYVSDAVTIDATTQPGYAGKPLIELNGTNSGGYGLNVGGGGSTIKGLAINKYSSGILLVKKGGDTIQGCYLGLGLDGVTAAGNKDKGIISQTANNVIGGSGKWQGNVISGNTNEGIQFYTYTAANNKFQGNFVGTNAAGTAAVPNGRAGVAIFGAPGTLIGGTTAGARNLISGNKTDGVVINTKGANGCVIQGNYIGTDVTGTQRVANLNYGIETSDPGTLIGGPTVSARNIVSGNGYTGVVLWTRVANGCLVQNNYIGTDVTGTKDLGNYWRGIDVSNGSYGNVVKDNLVSGNDIDGILLYQGYSNTIQNNTIGFDVSRKKALPNFGNGIRMASVTDATLIGNYIGNNGGYGLFRTGGGTITLTDNILINDLIFNL